MSGIPHIGKLSAEWRAIRRVVDAGGFATTRERFCNEIEPWQKVLDINPRPLHCARPQSATKGNAHA